MLLTGPDIASLIIYISALLGTIANVVLIFVFVGNAIKSKVFRPLDRIIVNMAVVNLLLCLYKEIPGLLLLFNTKVFDPVSCKFLLYFYHTLRLISIWSVQNLSLLHLIKIRRPDLLWSKFIHRHQTQYVNWSLAGCWVFTIIYHIPYLLYIDTADIRNRSNTLLTSTNCIRPLPNMQVRHLTYSTVSVDFLLIILVIILNYFTMDLICRHRRQVRDTAMLSHSWNKHTAQATKILLSLLSLYVICWISSDLVWLSIVCGLLEDGYTNDMLSALYGILSSIYYSVSSCIILFGYRQVKDYLAKAGNCCHRKGSTPTVQSIQQH
ncbi:vomeronasal type-1 receptor 105-like [Gastrophryne carolinensis]